MGFGNKKSTGRRFSKEEYYEKMVTDGAHGIDFKLGQLAHATENQQKYYCYQRGKFISSLTDRGVHPDKVTSFLFLYDQIKYGVVLDQKICDIGGMLLFSGMGGAFMDDIKNIL